MFDASENNVTMYRVKTLRHALDEWRNIDEQWIDKTSRWFSRYAESRDSRLPIYAIGMDLLGEWQSQHARTPFNARRIRERLTLCMYDGALSKFAVVRCRFPWLDSFRVREAGVRYALGCQGGSPLCSLHPFFLFRTQGSRHGQDKQGHKEKASRAERHRLSVGLA